MTRRLSTYLVIARHRAKHGSKRKVDYYVLHDRVVHIIHDGGCQRAMTADGLCSCEDPETYEIERDKSDIPGRRWA